MTTERQLESIFLILFALVDLSYVTVAVVFLHSCPKGRMIPVYNIVSGILNLSIILVEFLGASYCKSCLKYWNTLCKIFEGVWLAAGCYWTYDIYPPDYDSESSPEYCHKGFYTFAIVTVSISCFVYLNILCFELYVKCLMGAPPEVEEKPAAEVAVPEIVPALAEIAQASTQAAAGPPRRDSGKRSSQKLEIRRRPF